MERIFLSIFFVYFAQMIVGALTILSAPNFVKRSIYTIFILKSCVFCHLVIIPILCYNINVPRERKSNRTQKKIKKNLKNLLTNPKTYGIIKTKKGKENPTNQKGIDTMKKLIKKDYYNAIANAISEMDGVEVLAVIKEQNITPEMALDFIEKEIAALDKKNAGSSDKMTEKQKENETYKAAILKLMAENPDKAYSVSDLIKTIPEFAGFSNQKISAVVRLMKENDKSIKKEMVKRVAVFSLADGEEE